MIRDDFFYFRVLGANPTPQVGKPHEFMVFRQVIY